MSACGATNEAIDRGSPCIRPSGHAVVNLPHTTENNLWWHDAETQPACAAQYGKNPDLCHYLPGHVGPHSNQMGTTWSSA